MKTLTQYISESNTNNGVTTVYLNKSNVFGREFDDEFVKICQNAKNEPMRYFWSKGLGLAMAYSEYCFLSIAEDRIRFVDKMDMTSGITFKVAKAKLKSKKPLTPNDLKTVTDYPVSWGNLKRFTEEDNVEACRIITCLLYNHYIGEDINLDV